MGLIIGSAVVVIALVVWGAWWVYKTTEEDRNSLYDAITRTRNTSHAFEIRTLVLEWARDHGRYPDPDEVKKLLTEAEDHMGLAVNARYQFWSVKLHLTSQGAKQDLVVITDEDQSIQRRFRLPAIGTLAAR